jgi:transposase
VAIYQELVDAHGFEGSYSSVRRFVRKLRGSGIAKTFAVIHTEPGEEAQVDYGTGPIADRARRAAVLAPPRCCRS